jgi:DNA-binding NtrC family response regulator
MPVRVLIVEEDKTASEALARMVSDLGHEPVAAETVAHALAAISAGTLHLCLLSLRLTAESIEHVISAARARPIPVVACTQYATVAEIVSTVRMGIVDFVSWPLDNESSRQTIDRALARSGQDQGATVHDLPTSRCSIVKPLGPAIVDLPPHGVDLRLLLTQLEDRLIGQALERTGGNKNRAAGLLGLNRTTLVEKLRRRSVA